MSQAITPKAKASYRILFSAGDNASPAGNVVRKVAPKIFRQPNQTNVITDLDAAVNSITSVTSPEGNNATDKATMKKNFGTPNMLTLNSADAGGKLEKILFFPKYVQKRVTLLSDQKRQLMKKDDVVQSPSPLIPKVRPAILSPGKDRDWIAPKRRKLGDIALETWNSNKKSIPVEAAVPIVQAPPQPVDDKIFCKLCGNAIEDEVMDLINPTTGDYNLLGAELKSIIRHDPDNQQEIPSHCCKGCSSKIHICFSLLVELRAGVEVMASTSGADPEPLTITHQMYTCQHCEQEIMGMSEFIQHHENHIKERNVGSTQDLSKPKEVKADHDSLLNLDDLMTEAVPMMEENVDDDGLPTFQNEMGDFVCELCNRTFKHLFLLVLHRKAPRRGKKMTVVAPVNNDALSCFVCGETKATLSQSYEPCSKCKEETKLDHEEVRKSCDICGKSVLEECLAKHRASHRGKRYFCDVCSKGFALKYALRSHLLNHQGEIEIGLSDFFCDYCSSKFKTPREFRMHMKKAHGEHVTCLSQYLSCPKCPNSYPDMFRLRVHMRVIHNTELPFQKRVGGRVRQIECHVCGKILNSENATRSHMRDEHGLANHQMEVLKQACEVCGKLFSVKQNLINHINSAHLKIKPMSCDVCGERFGKHSSLIFHKMRHTGEKPFQCTVCFKTYRQRNDVIRHLARHVRDKEVEYERAHAVNTSSSKFVSKRYIYLKDSTIKGLIEVAQSDSLHRRKSAREKVQIEEDPQTNEVYEEVVLGEGTVLMASDSNQAYEKGGVVRYVMAEGEDGQYIIQGDDNEDVEYVIEDGDGTTSYVVAEDDGEITYVDADGKAMYVINEEDEENIRYILEDDDDDGDQKDKVYEVSKTYEDKNENSKGSKIISTAKNTKKS